MKAYTSDRFALHWSNHVAYWSQRSLQVALIWATILGMVPLGAKILTQPATAQAQLPACQPPRPDEYLLLVVTPDLASQAKVRESLPPNAQPIVCNYLNRIVTRVEGFVDLNLATSWAQYMNDVQGLPAFVAQPAQPTPTTPAPASQNPTPMTPNPTSAASVSPPPGPTLPVVYSPRVLGKGFAVIVDYKNQPEEAARLRRLLGRDIGLVSYAERPYLLANYTPNSGTANATLRALSENGFTGRIVDGQQVVLLRDTVNYQ